MYDVITVGSATIDVFAHTDSEMIKIYDGHGETDFLAYGAGSKMLVTNLRFTVGGGGTNTAVSLAKLGLKVAYLGKVGNDHNSYEVIQSLRRERIDTGLVARGKGTTGFSIILDGLEHDRAILAAKGINDDLREKDVKWRSLKAKWFYFSSMMNHSFRTQQKIAEYARKKGIKVMFNPSLYLCKLGIDSLKTMLSLVDILVFNLDEARCLLKDDDCSMSQERIMNALRGFGPGIVIITNGNKPAKLMDDKYIYTLNPTKVKPVETTGAGDAFASSFLAGFLKRKGDIDFSLRIASANAESVITHYGAKNKLLRWDEALALMRRERVVITKKRYKR